MKRLNFKSPYLCRWGNCLYHITREREHFGSLNCRLRGNVLSPSVDEARWKLLNELRSREKGRAVVFSRSEKEKVYN